MIHSDLPIVIERYSFKNRIEKPRRKTFSFEKEFLLHNLLTALAFTDMNFYTVYKPIHFLIS